MYRVMLAPSKADDLEDWLNSGKQKGFKLVACNGEFYIFESVEHPRAADLRQHCGHHANYLMQLGNGKTICGFCGASR